MGERVLCCPIVIPAPLPTSTGSGCTFWVDHLTASVFDLAPRRPEAQAMTGTDPYVGEILGHLGVETTEIRELSPPSAAAAPVN